MKLSRLAVAVVVLAHAGLLLSQDHDALDTRTSSSAATSEPDTARATALGSIRNPGLPAPKQAGMKPFSTVAFAVKMGIAGVGLDVATPLASRVNLRIGGSFLNISPTVVEDGINIGGKINLRSVNQSLDVFPFGNAFRISPGVTFYNGNHITAVAAVAGGQTFELNSVDYISSPSDPIHGSADMTFGHRVAPSLTLGFGNMISRKGGHWSVPFEIGAEYIGKAPAITLNLGGTACQGNTAAANCMPIASSPSEMQNVMAEQNQANSSIPSALRFFPILSTGVSYRFGRGGGVR